MSLSDVAEIYLGGKRYDGKKGTGEGGKIRTDLETDPHAMIQTARHGPDLDTALLERRSGKRRHRFTAFVGVCLAVIVRREVVETRYLGIPPYCLVLVSSPPLFFSLQKKEEKKKKKKNKKPRAPKKGEKKLHSLIHKSLLLSKIDLHHIPIPIPLSPLLFLRSFPMRRHDQHRCRLHLLCDFLPNTLQLRVRPVLGFVHQVGLFWGGGEEDTGG